MNRKPAHRGTLTAAPTHEDARQDNTMSRRRIHRPAEGPRDIPSSQLSDRTPAC